MVLRVRNCQDNDETLLLDGLQWAVYSAGDVFTLTGYGDTCWEVLDLASGSGLEDVTVEACYQNCEDCTRTAYLLTDCTGRLTPRYTTQDFESIVGDIIKVPYYGNACFTVSIVKYDKSATYEEIEYSNVYTNCESCRQREVVIPNIPTERCDPEKTHKIKTSFAESLHQEVMSKRFGVKFCCLTDKNKYYIKNELLDFDLKMDDNPELPEPYVESCCIQIEDPCVLPQNNCTSCSDEVPSIPPTDCNCTASIDSPHDCHTYTFTVPQEMLDLAIGNSNNKTNGKAYFGYIPCGETEAVTESYTEVGEQSYCVLGIPIIGYFANNVWIDLSTELLLRGNICEI